MKKLFQRNFLSGCKENEDGNGFYYYWKIPRNIMLRNIKERKWNKTVIEWLQKKYGMVYLKINRINNYYIFKVYLTYKNDRKY